MRSVRGFATHETSGGQLNVVASPVFPHYLHRQSSIQIVWRIWFVLGSIRDFSIDDRRFEAEHWLRHSLWADLQRSNSPSRPSVAFSSFEWNWCGLVNSRETVTKSISLLYSLTIRWFRLNPECSMDRIRRWIDQFERLIRFLFGHGKFEQLDDHSVAILEEINIRCMRWSFAVCSRHHCNKNRSNNPADDRCVCLNSRGFWVVVQ